jgi:hypothetical protein
MNIVDFIKNGKKRGLSDDFILEEIKKQAPHKKESFERASDNGATASEILNEIIKQNDEREAAKKNQEEKNKQKETPLKKKEKKNIFNRKKGESTGQENAFWIRVFIALLFVCITSLSLAFFYRSLFVPKIESIHPVKIIEEVSIPHTHYPLIKIDPEKDDVIRFAASTREEYLIGIRNLMREEYQSEIIRIIVEKQEGEDTHIFNLSDFFNAFDINPPEALSLIAENDFDLFMYNDGGINNLSFIVKFDKDDSENLRWMIMRPWEETIEKDFSYFFGYFGEKVPETKDELSSVDYRSEKHKNNTSIRYREGENNMGIYYTIVEGKKEDHLIFGTSLKTIQTIIDRHYQL